MLRGVMVGLGNVAIEGHLPAWKDRKDVVIVGGVDSSKDRAALFKKNMPEAQTFGTLDEAILSLKPDFVDIATPPHTHFSIIKTALRAGLHVLCEKPLVLKKSEIEELALDREDSGKVLMTVHNWKYAPICREISSRLESGVIGKPKRLEWYVLRTGPSVTTDKENWRLNPEMSGGGILIDHGWHAFYLLLEWLKADPLKVKASLEKRQYEDLSVEDTAKVTVDFHMDGPASAEVFLTWASRVRKNSGLIEGSKGRILMEDDRLIIEKTGQSPETVMFDKALSAGSHHPDWFNFIIDEFLSEISDASKSGNNFYTSQACFKLIEKSKESSEKNAAPLVY